MASNLRFWILVLTGVIAGGVYAANRGDVAAVTQTYALLSVTYLWAALMATPITRYFPGLPWRGRYIFARRGIGVSAWCFGLLHAIFGFFGELGGFEGLGFWNGRTWAAVSASTTALIILTAMAATSTDWAIQKLTFAKWKTLHRLVYAAAMLTVYHALTMGSHFAKLSGTVPMAFLGAAGFLGVFEAARLGKYLAGKIPRWPFWLLTAGVWLIMTVLSLKHWGAGGIIYSTLLGGLAGRTVLLDRKT